MSEEYGFRQDAGGLDDPDRSLDFDRLFELLSNRWRRYALYCFVGQSDSKVTTSTLVDELTAIERRTSAQECSRREIELSLRHTHLPKLAETPVIDYDPDRSEVVYRGGPRLEAWVEMARESEIERPSE